MINLNLERVFIVAVLSANHNGSLEFAIESIRAAKRSGADAIKLQTYKPETITIKSSNNDFFKVVVFGMVKLFMI